MKVLTVGAYRIYFTIKYIDFLAEQIAWFLDSLSSLIGNEVTVKGKRVRINDIYAKEENEKTYIIIEFDLLENPVPLGAFIAGLLAVLGVVGTLLVFEKIEKISESPLGTGIGVSLSVGSIILLGLLAYLIFKRL